MNLSFRRIASSFALAGLAGLAALTAVACSAAPGTEGTDPVASPSDAPVTKIDATALASVPAGQRLVLDVSRPDVAYDFDYSATPLEFSRITLHFAPGHDVPMTDWLAQTAVDGHDSVSLNPGHFIVRPVASGDVHPETLIPDQPGPCVTFCMWVCTSAMGPCTYKCITNCP